MKVRVCYTTKCPNEWRGAIRRYYGEEGLATREECQQWLERFGSSMDDELAAYYGPNQKEQENDS